ncbi:MAG: hypothetical protein IT458_06995 [Planctomycetes bacterium]|nr:hypothetical protein [Planctomycetota bacterium]
MRSLLRFLCGPDHAPASVRRAGQAGVSLAETAVASLLTTAVLAMVAAGVRSVHTATRESDALVRRASMQRNVVSALRQELEATSIAGSRFRLGTDNRSIRFAKLIGAERSGAEVSGFWSSEVEIALRDGGNVVRTQDDTTALLASGIADLRITQPTGTNYFEVTISGVRRNAAVGEPVTTTRSFRIYPKN